MSIIQEALRKAGNAEQKPEVRREEKPEPPKEMPKPEIEIGRASCRERV